MFFGRSRNFSLLNALISLNDKSPALVIRWGSALYAGTRHGVAGECMAPHDDQVNPLQAHIRQLLDERGWSEADLARRARLPRSTVNRLLKGRYKKEPETKTLQAVATALNVPLVVLEQLAMEALGRPTQNSMVGPEVRTIVAALSRVPEDSRPAVADIVMRIIQLVQRQR